MAVGVAGGVYGIGGGSILGPVLAGRGIPVSEVASAALAYRIVSMRTPVRRLAARLSAGR
jgi:hypothetical protein